MLISAEQNKDCGFCVIRRVITVNNNYLNVHIGIYFIFLIRLEILNANLLNKLLNNMK